MEDEPDARAEKLRQQIRHHDERYHQLAAPEIDDASYDALVAELRRLEERHPELQSDESPTARLPDAAAASRTGFPPARHAAPMLSLDNVFSEGALRAWGERVARAVGAGARFVCELKIDGLAVALTYEDGRYLRGATRGDGEVGEDLTENLRAVAGVLERLPAGAPPRLEVRGEVFLPSEAFERLNRGPRQFANARNAAAGSVRQKDPELVRSRGLALWCYGMGFRDGAPLPDHHTALDELRALGLPVEPHAEEAASLEEALAYCRRWERERRTLGFATDGAVIKIDQRALQEELGATARAPRWAVAWKFAAEERTTRVARIDVHTGRTGKVTPFAVLEPVTVGGATITYATLHNEGEVHRKDVRAGDTVVVRRAGEVMPEIVAPVPSLRPPHTEPFRFPASCPSCGAALVRAPGEADARCPNRRGCPSQGVEWLFHFASTEAMDVRGLGYRTGMLLLERGLVRDPGDLYALDAASLAELPGFGPRSVARLLGAIDDARARPLWRLLVALNIRHVGATAARLIARAFPSLPALLDATDEGLRAVPGVGPVIAAALHGWFADPENRATVEKLIAGGLKPVAEAAPSGPLAGRKVVLTGTFPSLSRARAIAVVEAAGGQIGSAVSRRTHFVVAGADPGTKLARAQALGIEIIDEAELLRRAGAAA